VISLIAVRAGIGGAYRLAQAGCQAPHVALGLMARSEVQEAALDGIRRSIK
jgi:hypothetical protein